jgi:class 3 adenylate cyclase
MPCAACGHEAPAASRFCPACGAPLAPRPADDATRKTVSVVFIDLAGSTALGERLDPESLHAVMGRWFDVVRAALERHGGTVEKFIGDAVMAVFGVPAVHEDDALRAARAALEVQEALGRLNDELESRHGVRLAARTGVNTGEVVVGGPTTDQRLATGDAVNVAARLEQAASPGEILVGELTHAALREAADLEPVPALAARGKREPLSAWRLVAVRPGAQALVRSIGTPFVGRRAELDRLHQTLEAARAERSCRMATIVGAPGTGKSRLAREFLASLGGARALAGHCLAYGSGSTYLPLAQAVREVAGDDPLPRLGALLRDTERGAAAARLVAGAIGGRGGGSPEETAWAFRRLFEALAASAPLVLLVDDIHWAEAPLLDLLEYLVGFSSGAPILVLCLARPELLETRPSWGAPQPRSVVVPLEPLSREDAGRLVDGLRRPLPLDVRNRIVETSEGNPLFVEQILAMLADNPDAADDAVPATIQALLAARVDRLPPAERTVLQRAAVEGRHFHRGTVAELLGPAAAAGLGAHLLALTRKEFLRPDRAALAGDDAFRFGHALIRDVAYASLTKEARAVLHARLAEWLAREDVLLTARDEIVGHHLEQAVGYRHDLGRAADAETLALAGQGGERLAAAGRRALERDEPITAVSLLERACHLLEADAAARGRLLPDLARALRQHGRLEAAEKVAQEAAVTAQQAGDELGEQRARIEELRIAFMRTLPDPDALRASARRAIEVFERHAAEADLADAWQLMGTAELSAGDRREQLAAVRRAREHAIASGDMRRQIDAWNEVGGSMLFGRTPVDEVLAFIADELAWSREHGLPAVEADALLGGPYLLSRLGRFGEARAQLERSKAICRELGLTYGLCEAHSAGADMEMLADAPAAAERELLEGIALAGRMGAARYESMYRVQRAHALLSLGRTDDARDELERTRERSGRAVPWKAAWARLLARTNARVEAAALARELAGATRGDDLTARGELHEQVAEVLQACGDTGGAAQALAEAQRLHEEKGNALQAERCRRSLAAVSGARGAADP